MAQVEDDFDKMFIDKREDTAMRLAEELKSAFNGGSFKIEHETFLSCGWMLKFKISDTSKPDNQPDDSVIEHAAQKLDEWQIFPPAVAWKAQP